MGADRRGVASVTMLPTTVDASPTAIDLGIVVGDCIRRHVFSNVDRPAQVPAAAVSDNSATGIAAGAAVGQPSEGGRAAGGAGVAAALAVKTAAGGPQGAVQAAAAADGAGAWGGARQSVRPDETPRRRLGRQRQPCRGAAFRLCWRVCCLQRMATLQLMTMTQQSPLRSFPRLAERQHAGKRCKQGAARSAAGDTRTACLCSWQGLRGLAEDARAGMATGARVSRVLTAAGT